MSFEGGTYTIVVDKYRNIASVTLNGKPLVDKDQDLQDIRPYQTDAPAPFNSAAYNVSPPCICLGEYIDDIPGGAHVWKWSKIF
jgi:hypothetical protein